MKLAYVISVFGQERYTDQVLEDINKQSVAADVFIVDNKGDYIVPNLRGGIDQICKIRGYATQGWLRSTNMGTKIAADSLEDYYAFVWLNNDVRLSKDFTAGITNALSSLGGLCGVLAPCYDDAWRHQRASEAVPAASYEAVAHERRVPFVDKACMVVPRWVWTGVGELDPLFARYGWGAEFDYCIRTRFRELENYVTERAFFNHFGGGTAKIVEENYEGPAGEEMHTGMLHKYGPGWEELLS